MALPKNDKTPATPDDSVNSAFQFDDVAEVPNFTQLTNPYQDKVNELADHFRETGNQKWTRVHVRDGMDQNESEWVRAKVRAAAGAINMGGQSKVAPGETKGWVYVYFSVRAKSERSKKDK